MQSRLAATAAGKLNRIISSSRQELFLVQRIGFATSTGRTADPAIHSEEPEEVGANEAITNVKHRYHQSEEPTTKSDDPYVTPKSPIQSETKIQNPAAGSRVDPVGQQRRRNSTRSAATGDVSCVGLDGSPWAEEDETSMKEQRREQAEDQKEYFKHHKASPLSEIEISDSRKPITRASDGKKDAFGYEAGEVIVFRPEQVDSAEDSLRRATEIFRANAVRGDLDSPHGRVLRQLRGEYW